MRSAAVQEFLGALEAAFGRADMGAPARACLDGVFAAAKVAGTRHDGVDETLTVLRWFEPALAGAGDLGRALRALGPELRWSTRKNVGPGASAGFADAHANAVVLGPEGLERRADIWVGISLMAPGTCYPDHDHPPEEVYLVVTEGDFFQAGSGWTAKAPGETVYNPPGILHAMRAGSGPFLAIWCLRA